VTRRWRRLVIWLALAVVVPLGACGLPADDEPQAIAPKDLPGDLLDPNPGPSTTLSESSGTTTVVVYLLEDTAGEVRLVEVEREVTEARTPDERLATLFDGATREETADGLITAIPPNSVLIDVATDPEGLEVIVDVSADLLTIEGPRLAQAFAQIVWTATEPGAGGFDRVRFLVEGESSTVLDGDGVDKDGSVRRADYSNFSPDD
jgi:spore germination protein GerM